VTRSERALRVASTGTGLFGANNLAPVNLTPSQFRVENLAPSQFGTESIWRRLIWHIVNLSLDRFG